MEPSGGYERVGQIPAASRGWQSTPRLSTGRAGPGEPWQMSLAASTPGAEVGRPYPQHAIPASDSVGGRWRHGLGLDSLQADHAQQDDPQPEIASNIEGTASPVVSAQCSIVLDAPGPPWLAQVVPRRA